MKHLLFSLSILLYFNIQCQIDLKFLTGTWCVEKITNVPVQKNEIPELQSQIMDEFHGVRMLFSGEGAYAIYLEATDESDDYQEFANYEFISRENKLVIRYENSDEELVFFIEKLTKNQLVFVSDDEYGKNRFYMKRCD